MTGYVIEKEGQRLTETGGLHDPDTRLTRFGARDYDATTGRWISKDPIGFIGGVNVFEYAQSDPAHLVDPSGLLVRIRGSVAAQFAGQWAIGSMLRNQDIGSEVALALMDTQNVHNLLLTDDPTSHQEGGGGFTSNRSKRNGGGFYCDSMASVPAHLEHLRRLNPPADPSLEPLDWTSISAHELGHNFANVHGQDSHETAMRWENAMRRMAGQRERNTHGWPRTP
ncbi:MAG: RHS repeat-associated core domain-containing protein [Myxococcaceae bacterium]